MGGALYAASSSKAAADTYAESAKPKAAATASTSTAAPTATHAASAHSAGGTSNHSAHNYAAPAATHTTVVHNNSGNDGLLMGYVLGSASRGSDRPVVINNGGNQASAAPAASGHVAPSAGQVGTSYTAPGETAQPLAPTRHAAAAQPVEQGESHWFRNLMVVLFLGGAGFGLYRLWGLRAARIAAATPTRNYSL